MPKTNEGRTTDAEANLARRIEYEREKRGMSYEALAKAMTEAGCKIQATAIHKVEKGDKQTGKLRRITVNELSAFAEVFEDGNVARMMRTVEEVELERAGELLAKLQGRNRQLARLVGEMFNDFVDLAVVWQEEEDIYSYVMGYFQRSPLGADPAGSPATTDEPEDGAFDVLTWLLTDIASRTWHAVSTITLMYMNTLIDQERGEGPTEDELKQWVAEWSAEPSLDPPYDVAVDRFITRVEDWTERMRATHGEHQ